MDRRSRRWRTGALALAAGAALCAGTAWALQDELTAARYEIPLPAELAGLDGLTIAQVADVHSADVYEPLRAALEQAAPDLIVCTGDLVNREDREFSCVLALMAMAADAAPTYFTPGNHEADNPLYPQLREELASAGITVLEDGAAQLTWNGETVNVIGMRDLAFSPDGREEARQALSGRVRELCADGAWNILLSHRPSLMEEYAQSGAELVFSGHAHGGQVRLPLVGPLFAPDEGVLPRYTAGAYQAGDAWVVVSRGLGNGTPFPRLWNGPELVLVTLRAGQGERT